MNMKIAMIATAGAIAVATPAAATCADWKAIYAADIHRLNALARLYYQGHYGADYLLSETLKRMVDDGKSAESDECVWGD
jgi:hypothetical protein